MGKLLSTIVAGMSGLTFLGSAVVVVNVVDDENDPFDDTLTPITRAIYKYEKNRCENNPEYRKEIEDRVKEGKGNVIDQTVITSLKHDHTMLVIAHAQAANYQSHIESARTAPPITFLPIAPQPENNNSEAIDVVEKINIMEQSYEITEQESQSLKEAWVAAGKTGDSKNAFKEAAIKILSSDKDIGRDQTSVNDLTLQLVK